MTLLIADSISKSFGDRRILSAARLQVRRGQIVGLLGRMGSGKSTLMKICAGILRPDSGWIELNGVRSHRPNRSKLARLGLFHLGENDNLAWTLTVRGHFDEIARRFNGRLDEETLELLEIDPLLDRRVYQLSAGEIKRVEMALAFARNPCCLFADELMRSADPVVSDLLGRSMRSLASRGCGIVVSGHEVNHLMPFLDSITWVTSGTSYDLGSKESALANEMFVREYLGRRERTA